MDTDKRLYYFFWIILIAVQAVWIYNSGGFYFIDDSSHYNFNRFYLETFWQSTGAWHRVGRVLLFALPAQFGLKGVQIASGIIFLLTIYFSYKILKHYSVKYAEWIIPFIGFQPVLFNISYTSLAELPAAFLIVLSFYFFIKDKPAAVMILSSLVFIFRTEYFYVSGFYFLVYAYRKNFRMLPLIITGPLFWYLYTTIITLNPSQFFYDMTLHARLLKIDVGVDWYFYLLHSGKIFGFMQMLFFFAAIIIMIIKKDTGRYGLPVLFALGGIAVQTLLALKGLNLTCSVGQLRYVAVIGPMIGIVSVYAFSLLLQKINNRIVFISISAFILAITYIFGPYATPWHSRFKVMDVSDDIVKLVREKYPEYVILTHLHQVANALDEPSTGGKYYQYLTMTNMKKYDKAIIVWSSELEGNAFIDENVTLEKIQSFPDITLLKEYKDLVNNSYSAPIYSWRKEGDEHKISREIIDYMVHDQTTWENIDIRLFIKTTPKP